jgi:hypothetical protein
LNNEIRKRKIILEKKTKKNIIEMNSVLQGYILKALHFLSLVEESNSTGFSKFLSIF